MLAASAFAALSALATVWDGVYTAAQAERGRAAYDRSCSVCHRADLGGGQARPLVGPKFWESWGEDVLGSLFSVMRERMPESAPGSLDDRTYADILAYILQRNEYPAGDRDLTTDTVKDIHVVGRNGPAPVPNFALVRAVGCLEERRPGVWVLTRSSEPYRTRDPAASRGDERARSLATPLGNHEFELMDAYDEPSGHTGQKAEVKGLLMRGKTDRLNFSSLQVLDSACLP
jgi:mono/diheme cytochrome c family protein